MIIYILLSEMLGWATSFFNLKTETENFVDLGSCFVTQVVFF